MARNFSAARGSKMRCHLGRSEYEQVREREPCSAAASDARRATVAAQCGAGGSGSRGGGVAFDSERLERASQRGRTGGATAANARPTFGSRCAAACRTGAAAEGWGTRPRVCDGAVDLAAGRAVDRRAVWPPIQREPSVADSAGARLQQPAGPPGRALERDEGAIRRWKRERWPA